MTEEKENTVSVRIFQRTQDALLGEQLRVKRTGRPKPSIAALIQAAWDTYSISSTTTKGNSERVPPSETGTKVGLAKTRESPRMESPRPFYSRLSELLGSVPDEKPLHAVEDYLLVVAENAIAPLLPGVKTDGQRAPNKQKDFRRIKDLRDNPEDVEDLSGKSA